MYAPLDLDDVQYADVVVGDNSDYRVVLDPHVRERHKSFVARNPELNKTAKEPSGFLSDFADFRSWSMRSCWVNQVICFRCHGTIQLLANQRACLPGHFLLPCGTHILAFLRYAQCRQQFRRTPSLAL